MQDITKPSITRLARRAGVKSISDDCVIPVRVLINNYLDEILSTAYIFNTEHNTKTLMNDDIYNAMSILGYNITHSSNLGVSSSNK